MTARRAGDLLTFEDRVRAQEAIERVYYSHQIGATRPFEEAFPREALERKVRRYLNQSVALEELWNTPLSSEMLRAELERMARQTRMPGRLREIFARLDDDAVLIQDTLVRAALADRLSRNFFAFDRGVHAEARDEAEGIRRELIAGRLDVSAEHPRRDVIEVVPIDTPGESGRPALLAEPEKADPTEATRLEMEPREFKNWRERFPDRTHSIGPVEEERERFTVRVLLEEEEGRVVAATYSFPKKSWSEWWSEESAYLGEPSGLEAVADDAGLPVAGTRWAPGVEILDPEVGRSFDGGSFVDADCVPDDTWNNGSLDDLPSPRKGHAALWTGSLMIVWGGYDPSYVPLNTGGRYDPVTDTWTPISTTDAPAPSSKAAAVWTGSQMLIWGGWGANYGGRYDPSTDSWTPISAIGAPSFRYEPSAVWTGSEMLVWGGVSVTTPGFLNTGGRYDPETDSWTPVSTVGAPSARALHTAVWTGSLMLVWGGNDEDYTNTGGRYDPTADSWTPISTLGAPSARMLHRAVWTGDLMLVWGGEGYVDDVKVQTGVMNTGGRYDPVTDTWTPTSTLGAPSARENHTAVWTGSQMVVWGGGGPGAPYSYYSNTGGRYDPATDSWTPTSTVNAPSIRGEQSAVWTGSLMIVWGGSGHGLLNTGGRYHLETDSWTPTSTLNAPSARAPHKAVWTGSLMLIWGLSGASSTGGRYDPATDSWTPISTLNSPSIRGGHSAVWAGDLMLVWGGRNQGVDLNTGGRYDPATDAWTPISTIGAPSARSRHKAVWTGDLMLVWGGAAHVTPLDTGGRYDPANDSWTPISTSGAPHPRYGHTAVWTGNLMLVWGGDALNDGGRYDPLTDSWTPISTLGAPSGRRYHTAVWTGNLMIVWGGISTPYGYLGTGGRYDPANDSWSPTSTLGAPSVRWDHTALWTGSSMVVWGGDNWHERNTGGRYDPASDAWTPTSKIGAPSPRGGHAAVWTGSLMIVWGGYDGVTLFNNGGRYSTGESADSDGDGFPVCGGDCDDGDPAIHPEGPDLPGDRIDQNCDSVLACDPDGEWRNHGMFVRCVSRECGRLAKAGAFPRADCARLVRDAAMSTVGR